MAVREFAEFGAQFVAIPAKLAYDRKNERKGLGAMKRTDEQLQELLLRELSGAGKLRRKQLIEAGLPRSAWKPGVMRI